MAKMELSPDLPIPSPPHLRKWNTIHQSVQNRKKKKHLMLYIIFMCGIILCSYLFMLFPLFRRLFLPLPHPFHQENSYLSFKNQF